MSRSNPDVKLESPCTRYFEWNSDASEFKYYDKLTKKNVSVPLPFQFIVLDQLITIGGFDDSSNSRFWSNEIHKKSFKTGVLKVRNGSGPVCSGIYNEIKNSAEGMKYAESVYVAYLEDGKLKIGNIKMIGSSLSAWINFVSGEKDDKGKKISEPHNPEEGAIMVSSFNTGKKGKVSFTSPIFEQKAIKPETNEKVKDLDRELQAYLVKYFAKNNTAEEVIPTEEEVDATFEDASQLSAKEMVMSKQAAKKSEVEDDLPF